MNESPDTTGCEGMAVRPTIPMRVPAGKVEAAFVVANDKSLTIDELKEYCRANFTGYKVPKQYEIRESLPMSAVGKILRRELRDE